MATFKVIEDEESGKYVISGIVKIPQQYCKELKSLSTSKSIYFIDATWGLKNKLEPWMNFSVRYPKNKKWCELNLPIPVIITD